MAKTTINSILYRFALKLQAVNETPTFLKKKILRIDHPLQTEDKDELTSAIGSWPKQFNDIQSNYDLSLKPNDDIVSSPCRLPCRGDSEFVFFKAKMQTLKVDLKRQSSSTNL